MTTLNDQFLADLNEPPAQVNGMVTGYSPETRLKMAMRVANDSDPTNIPDVASWGTASAGVPNPYGRGLKAFEPNNVIFEAYAQAKDASDASKAKDAAEAPKTATVFGAADGKINSVVQAAMNLAQRAVPYVWGGTSATGVDCSGLLYYAFRSAGIELPRYRAVDYGHMGAEVPDLASARPGDVIYYDEPGNTDHVGLYIGNGLMVQAPQSGDHVRVTPVGKPTSIRRLFDDSKFSNVLQPDGSSAVAYNGRPYNPGYYASITPMTGTPADLLPRTDLTSRRPTSAGTFGSRAQ